MGIKRLLIDSRIQGIWTVWYGHIKNIKTGPDRRRNREEGRPVATGHGPWLPGQGRQPAAACAVV